MKQDDIRCRCHNNMQKELVDDSLLAGFQYIFEAWNIIENLTNSYGKIINAKP